MCQIALKEVHTQPAFSELVGLCDSASSTEASLHPFLSAIAYFELSQEFRAPAAASDMALPGMGRD